MDAAVSVELVVRAGGPVDVVLYDQGRTRLLKTEILRAAPLRLRSLAEDRNGVCAGRRVMLLTHQHDLALRADGHIDRVVTGNNGIEIEVGSVCWEIVERRRHIRVPVNLPITLRTVVPCGEAAAVKEIAGSTLDISISGAFVSARELPEEGSLVEFSTELDGKEVRTLALVAHVSSVRTGAGLHFVEYMNTSHHVLHTYLTRVA